MPSIASRTTSTTASPPRDDLQNALQKEKNKEKNLGEVDLFSFIALLFACFEGTISWRPSAAGRESSRSPQT